jgi:N-carbamoyl-L-amino-acid hydrolase
MAQPGRDAGLASATDAAGNLYVTMKGRDPKKGTFLIASHLDSVPQGGNFDGAAGVIAGIAILTAWKRANFQPAGEVTVMAIRAEESTWFPYSYIGSKAAFGILPKAALDIPRADTGRTLAQHMAKLGFDPEAVARGEAHCKRENLRGYVELHIEQGPVLIGRDIPVALVTGIRGSFRYREARILGEYGHSGAVPRAYRHDAVVAAAEFVTRLDQDWQRLEREGNDLTITIGKLFTDPAQHAFSKIAGEIGICIDVRSHSRPTLDGVKTFVNGLATEIAQRVPDRPALAEQLETFANVLAQPEETLTDKTVAPLFKPLDEWTLAAADYCLHREPTLDLTGALPKHASAHAAQKAAVAQAA